jgi:hypothetical protein
MSWNSMMNSGLRIIEKHFVRPVLFSPNAQLGFLASHWARPHPSDSIAKATDNLKNLTPKTGTTTIQVSHG